MLHGLLGVLKFVTLLTLYDTTGCLESLRTQGNMFASTASVAPSSPDVRGCPLLLGLPQPVLIPYVHRWDGTPAAIGWSSFLHKSWTRSHSACSEVFVYGLKHYLIPDTPFSWVKLAWGAKCARVGTYRRDRETHSVMDGCERKLLKNIGKSFPVKLTWELKTELLV